MDHSFFWVNKVYLYEGNFSKIFKAVVILKTNMRVSRLKKELEKRNIDFALFYNLDSENYNKNMYYFSGYKGIGCLIIHRKKPAFLLVPSMEYGRAKNTAKIEVYKWEKGKRLFEATNLILKKNKIKPRKIGVIYSEFNLNVYRSLRQHIKKVKIVDMDKECFELRKIKTDKEIKIIKKSCDLCSEILNLCINNFNRFETEKDVETFLHTETVKRGCELAFPPIVASGKAGSMPHYEPKKIKLRKGFCVIDFGVKYEGYCSDITRTIYLGLPTEKEIKIYNRLLGIQRKIIENIKPGKKCNEAYLETITLLDEYSENFTHGLGHGIGLNIHELPNLKSDSDETFKNNMIFTIEPGIYFENKFGIRIEDDVLIRNGKPIVLTKVQKKMIIKRK